MWFTSRLLGTAASVVLGIRSGAAALGSEQAQALQPAPAVMRTVLLVGFGTG
jgi:hypothetical protein